MGYQIFTVVFSDGTEQAYVAGNAVDFIEYPVGRGPRDVVGVLPNVGRDQNPLQAPKYYWCLYSDGEVPVHMRQITSEHRRLLPYLRFLLRRLFR
jgi:hypothetical protein